MPLFGAGVYGTGPFGVGAVSDAATVYSAADIDAALRASVRTIAFRYDLLDRNGALIGPFPNVISASIAYDSSAQIQRTARVSVREDPSVNYLSDQIKPWFRLKMPDGSWVEWPLGVFLLSTPPRRRENQTVRREIEGYDRCQILMDDKVTDRYTIAPSASYMGAVLGLLISAGIRDASLMPSALTLPAALDWPPGTPKLTIINDVLASMNYRALFFDANGTANALPYLSPTLRPLDFVYEDNDESVTLDGMTESLDLFNVANQWVLVVSEANRPPLRSSYTNSDPASPTSTVNRGRVSVRFDTNKDAADQTTLDAAVARLAFEESQVFEEVTFSTALMPGHGDTNVLYVGDSVLGLGNRYSEIKWSLDLAVGGQMAHAARRIVLV